MTAPNSREAQIGRMIETALAAGLTVHAIETEGRRVRVFTSPLVAGLPESQPAEDDADRWLRERRARKADRGLQDNGETRER